MQQLTDGGEGRNRTAFLRSSGPVPHEGKFFSETRFLGFCHCYSAKAQNSRPFLSSSPAIPSPSQTIPSLSLSKQHSLELLLEVGRAKGEEPDGTDEPYNLRLISCAWSRFGGAARGTEGNRFMPAPSWSADQYWCAQKKPCSGLDEPEEATLAVGRHGDAVASILHEGCGIGSSPRTVHAGGGFDGPADILARPGHEDGRGDGQRFPSSRLRNSIVTPARPQARICPSGEDARLRQAASWRAVRRPEVVSPL
jgi:hypothetical protein